MIFKQKHLLSLILFFYCVSGLFLVSSEETFPVPKGYVNDYSGVLSSDAGKRITSLCRIIKEKTGIEISVVFIDTTRPVDMSLYSVKLFEKWGIGEKGKDNGVLFISAVNDRRARIEVGYGLEGILTDGYCGEVLDSVTPYFAKGDYDGGVLRGVAGIVSKIAEKYNLDLKEKLPVSRYSGAERGNSLRSLITTLFFLFFIFARLGFSPFFIRRGYRYSGYRTSGFGGFGSSGGFGGFGGFGGGLSGGGGAGRSW